MLPGRRHYGDINLRGKNSVTESTLGQNLRQEMENLVFAGAHAACASIRFAGTVEKDVLDRIQANSDVLAVSLIDL